MSISSLWCRCQLVGARCDDFDAIGIEFTDPGMRWLGLNANRVIERKGNLHAVGATLIWQQLYKREFIPSREQVAAVIFTSDGASWNHLAA